MSSPMALREALALIDDVRADRSYCAAAGKHFAPPADLARARAIVDAAVEFIQRRADLDAIDATEPMDSTAYLNAANAMNDAEKKFRDLERGLESEGI